MAHDPAMKQSLRWIAKAFRAYANEQGWAETDFKVLVRVNEEWGRVHVILAARDFPGDDPQQQWLSVMDYLTSKFDENDPGLSRSVSLTLRTFDELGEAGPLAYGPQFVDLGELIEDGGIGQPPRLPWPTKMG